MSRLLGALTAVLLTVLLLASCGSEAGSSGEPELGARAEVVRLVSQTAGGGRGEATATRLGDDAEVDRYLARFAPALADRLRAAIEEESGEGTLWAQVVAVGCDVPPGASVKVGDDVDIRPDRVPSRKPECFAPVTTVALAFVPAGQ